MKKKIWRILTGIVIAVLLTLIIYRIIQTERIVETVVETKREYVDFERGAWNIFKEAVARVESGQNSNAVGDKDDVGYLQITPICVAEANRISGKKYTLEDRKSIQKSIEIWDIIQDFYNPTHNHHLALKIWNSKAPLSYHTKVMETFNNMIDSLINK